MEWLAWIVALGLCVFTAVLFSCFVKAVVVLSVLRSAFGAMVPPRSVVTAFALLLSVFVMAPVLERTWGVVEPSVRKGDAASLVDAFAKGREPVREFLAAHAPERERRSFLDLQRKLRGSQAGSVGENDLLIVAPAFVVGELKAAFQVGFLILLPFLILELIIAAILTTLGMHSLEARTVALPFKLLLFVVADGWHLIARGLVASYG